MEAPTFKRVCIVGAGTMGKRIGLQCAVCGYEVELVDCSKTALEGAVGYCSQQLQSRVEEGRITAQDREDILHRIHSTTSLGEGASRAELVIEAVPERLELKREIFARLDQLCPDHTILATNSSAIPVSAIEGATRRPDRVLNMHFYDPVVQPMVELMRGTGTSDETIRRARRFARSLDLTPLVVEKESMGFIINRVWRAVKKECLRVVADGVASHENVDRAWMLAWGMHIGPFGAMDAIGLDVVRDIETVYYQASGDESDKPPPFLLEMIERGELGVKTGKGFYTYPNPAYRDPAWLKGDLK